MKKSRFSESQIVAIFKAVELGAQVGETCRKHGVSELTLPLFGVVLSPTVTRLFYAVPRTSVARTASG